MSLEKKTRRDKTQTAQADEAQEFLIKGREKQTNKQTNIISVSKIFEPYIY